MGYLDFLDRCCPCLSRKTSAIVCTVIMLVLSLYTLYDKTSYLIGSGNVIIEMMNIPIIYFYSSEVFEIIISINFICLIIGIAQNKLFLMRPFKFIYLIYFFCVIPAGIYYTIVLNNYITHITEEDVEKIYGTLYRDNQKSYGIAATDEMGYSNVKSLLESTKTIAIVSVIITFIINTFYYITTRNYINSVEREEKKVDNVKSFENASNNTL